MNIFLAVGFVALLLALFALLFLLVGHNAAELEKLKKAHFELAKKHNGLLENHTELVSAQLLTCSWCGRSTRTFTIGVSKWNCRPSTTTSAA
jgi:hypothetical protein